MAHSIPMNMRLNSLILIICKLSKHNIKYILMYEIYVYVCIYKLIEAMA